MAASLVRQLRSGDDRSGPEARDLKPLLFPELGLAFAGEACGEEGFEAFDGRKYLVGAAEGPATDLFDRHRSDQIDGNAFAVGGGKFRGRAATLNGSESQKQIM